MIAELNGAIKDNNAKLFKQGYDSVLNPLYNERHVQEGDRRRSVDGLEPDQGRQIFDQMLAANGNKIDGVARRERRARRSGVASLKAHGLKLIPLTGQDATPTGVQFILAGWQSGTVYKSVKRGGDAAAAGSRSHRSRASPCQVRTATGQRHAVDPADSRLGHEGELQAPVHGRLPEEEPGLHRRLQEVLQVGDPRRRGRPRGPRTADTNAPVTSDLEPDARAAGVSKSFGSVQALRGVDFEVRDGEVMALVGDNGAGKSTLIKCVAGHPLDRRRRDLLRRRTGARSTGRRTPRKLGIEVVYQDLALCDNLDVVQNMYLGREVRDPLFRLARGADGAADRRDAEVARR